MNDTEYKNAVVGYNLFTTEEAINKEFEHN
jgi:hypothetical protein